MKSKSRYLTITLLSFSLAANAEICSAETSKNDIDAASFYSKSFEIVRRKDLQEFEDGIPIPINHAERVKFSHGGHLGYEKLFLLKKLDSEKTVAVIAVLSDDRAVLNPRYLNFEYGSFPTLENLTIEVADAAFTSDIKSTTTDLSGKIERKYALRSSSINGERVKEVKLILDIVFENKVLRKYRVLSRLIDPGWCSSSYDSVYDH